MKDEVPGVRVTILPAETDAGWKALWDWLLLPERDLGDPAKEHHSREKDREGDLDKNGDV